MVWIFSRTTHYTIQVLALVQVRYRHNSKHNGVGLNPAHISDFQELLLKYLIKQSNRVRALGRPHFLCNSTSKKMAKIHKFRMHDYLSWKSYLFLGKNPLLQAMDLSTELGVKVSTLNNP